MEEKDREIENKIKKETNHITKNYLISSKKIYQQGLNEYLEEIVFGSE